MKFPLSNMQIGRVDKPKSFLKHDLSPLSASTLRSTKAIRVLIVEDMKELAELLRENLLLHGFEVETANCGAVALELLKNKTFDVALIDIELPDVSGFKVVECARAAACPNNTRIVFCTGSHEEERLAQAQQFSGSEFIAKPFIIKKLLPIIAKTCAPRHPPEQIEDLLL